MPNKGNPKSSAVLAAEGITLLTRSASAINFMKFS
uniref:Uncharacterized protein n=1 Tax=Anguilla anguilla TaxID=7936 RepID=A0A0E9R6A1_ANGAN